MRLKRLQRREFITLLGGAAAAWPLAARAQQPDRMRRINVLMGYAESDLEVQAHIAAFREGLQKLGWTEGRNIQIDTRWAAPDDAASMRRFAKELVALQPDVILSNTPPTTTALLQQTPTIPIVFACYRRHSHSQSTGRQTPGKMQAYPAPARIASRCLCSPAGFALGPSYSGQFLMPKGCRV